MFFKVTFPAKHSVYYIFYWEPLKTLQAHLHMNLMWFSPKRNGHFWEELSFGNLSAVWATKTHRDTAVKTYSDIARKVQKKRSVKTQTKKTYYAPPPPESPVSVFKKRSCNIASNVSASARQDLVLQCKIQCVGKCKRRSYNVRSSRNTPTWPWGKWQQSGRPRGAVTKNKPAKSIKIKPAEHWAFHVSSCAVWSWDSCWQGTGSEAHLRCELARRTQNTGLGSLRLKQHQRTQIWGSRVVHKN